MKYLWKVWANALGVKAKDDNDAFSDHVAILRSMVVLVYVITNFVIVSGVIHRW